MTSLRAPVNSDKTTKRSATIRLSAAELREIVSDPNRWVQDTIAEYVIGTPAATLRRLRHEGRGPRYVKDGASVRYKIAWLLEYIHERTVETLDSVWSARA